MLIKLAWRNIFRNKRRTIIASIATGIGLASLIFAEALWVGMEQNMIDAATATFLGDGQIHRDGFRDTQEVEMTINALPELTTSLEKEAIIAQFTQRTLAFGMITSTANVSSINLVGINPTTEKHLSQIDDVLSEGTYFRGSNERDMLIGARLAAVLEVGMGDRVVITIAAAETGNLSQEMFRISGIYHFADEEMNQGMAFVRLGKAQQMLAVDNNVHQIAIKFTDSAYGRDKELPLW